ncbi:MAG TPA: SCO family protein [Chthoniobacterales bacterium]|nr:SCO family protein [Chthoniobacterales bacterium]
MSFRTKRTLAVAVPVILLGAVTLTAGPLERDAEHDYDPPVAGSYSLPVVKSSAGGGSLVDSTGKSVELRDLIHGRVTVLSFIYTRCASGRACPYATNVLGQLHLASAEDSKLARNMRLVSLSFDPEHDTPRQLANYGEAVRETDQGCEWRFVTAKSAADLKTILEGYGQAVDKRADPNDPEGPLYHILRVFLIDQQGRIRNIYSSGTLDPRLVLADVKTLLLENERK